MPPPVRRVEPSDVYTKDSTVPGAGRGVFARRLLPAGTILPYYAIIQAVDSPGFESIESTYFMTVSYRNPAGKFRAINKIIANGNPDLPGMKKVRQVDKCASYINESSYTPPNCILVNSPFVTKDMVYNSLKKGSPLPVTLIVLPYDVEKGSELFTMYGSDYGREYKVWRDRRGIKEDLLNASHEIVESNESHIEEMFLRKK